MEIILYDAQPLTEKTTPTLRQPLMVLWRQARSTSKRAFRLSGYILILLSFLISVVVAGPIVIQEVGYRLTQKPFASQKEGPSNPALKEQRQQAAEEARNYGVSPDFSIVIPKIDAKAKIIPNVNPADEREYKNALKEGVAHASGTKFPGHKGTIYLFAHSTNSPINIARYNAVFYLLKELRKEDEIIIFFAGQKYVYRVTERFVTAADDTKWLTNQEKEEQLVLQTCWPPGTSQKRLLVIAKPA
ncbi:MAG TPA: sortase [Patescibacteria group bacterium]|nr:sortase [Patescibacteria group bacterium]